jgi:hypothetical protein
LVQLTQQTGWATLGRWSASGPPEAIEAPPDTLAAAVALLPIFLETHESRTKRLQRLQALDLGNAPQISQGGLWLLGCAIGQACQGHRDDPAERFEALVTLCQHRLPNAPRFNDDLWAGLTQLKRLLQQPTPLRQAHTLAALPREPRQICQLLYAFFATPTEPTIAVARLLQMVRRPFGTEIAENSDHAAAAALVGALSGAYNGRLGLPLTFEMTCQSHPLLRAVPTLAATLHQAWSGQYQLTVPPVALSL